MRDTCLCPFLASCQSPLLSQAGHLIARIWRHKIWPVISILAVLESNSWWAKVRNTGDHLNTDAKIQCSSDRLGTIMARRIEQRQQPNKLPRPTRAVFRPGRYFLKLQQSPPKSYNVNFNFVEIYGYMVFRFKTWRATARDRSPRSANLSIMACTLFSMSDLFRAKLRIYIPKKWKITFALCS